MPLKFCYLINFSYWHFLKFLLIISPIKVTHGCLGCTAGKIMGSLYHPSKFFSPCWARGGRMLMYTIQLVELFAGSLSEQLFLLWFWIWFLLCCFCRLVFQRRLPSFSIGESRQAALSVHSFLLHLSIVKNYIRCFCTKHVRPESLKFLPMAAECVSVLCAKCTSLESTCTFLPLMRPTWNHD